MNSKMLIYPKYVNCFNFGVMGEQGAESIAHIMTLEKRYNIPNEVKKLHYIFKEQAIESYPSLSRKITDNGDTATA